MLKNWFRRFLLVVGLLPATLSAGCVVFSTTPIPESTLKTAFPSEIADWTPADEIRLYNSENLFDLVNGQADAFFVYGFEQTAMQTYTNADGDRLAVQIWQLATPTDAYGLFTLGRSGSPALIGNEGDAEPGRRLSFWQDRYTVHVSARQDVDDALLWDFAQAVVSVLPRGGERPALIDRLPQTDLKSERDFIFFHEELSIQDWIWLGGENILGLSQETNGVVASYEVADSSALLLLIVYPTPSQSAAGLDALQTAQFDNLVIVQTQANLLAAVFGEVDADTAQTLLKEALK